MSRHDIVIIGYDEQNQIAHVVDNDRADVQDVSYDALARARSSTAFPQPTRHGTYFLSWPAAVPDLRVVAADAFAQAAATMTNSDRTAIATPDPDAISATGIQAAHTFAEDLPRWPSLFDEHQLHNALLGLAAFIEKAGTGGLFRLLLAHGCAHIADRTRSESAAVVADAARRCAQAWTAVATAAAGDGSTAARTAHAAELAGGLPELELHLAQALDHSAQDLASGT